MRCIPHQWKQHNSKCDAGVNRRKWVAILQSTQAIGAFQDVRRWQLAILLWHEMAVNNIEANTVCSQPKIETYKALRKMTWKKQKLCRKIVLIDFCINEGNNAAISAIGEAGRWQLVLLQFDQMRTILRQVAATKGSSDSKFVPLSRQLTEMLRRRLGSVLVSSGPWREKKSKTCRVYSANGQESFVKPFYSVGSAERYLFVFLFTGQSGIALVVRFSCAERCLGFSTYAFSRNSMPKTLE